MNLEDYRKLQISKIFDDGCKSKGVFLLEGGTIVKKVYDCKNLTHVKRFKTEIKFLKHLQDCDFVPKILAIDKKHCTFYMNYCGIKPIENDINIKENQRLIKELHTKWNLVRKSKKNPQYKTSLINTTILDNKMYIIDFGSSNWIKIK